MSQPVVSIVINNYNYGRFLRDAIDSALAQTYDLTEVIVVDDGSTDDSRSIIASYGERVIAVLKENGGQGSAVNAGFAASRGEVVLFLDADDTLQPEAAASVVNRATADGVAKVQWRLRVINADGSATRFLEPASALAEGDLLSRAIEAGPLSWRNAPMSGNAWSRRFLAQVLPMPAGDDQHGADAYLSMLAPVYGSIVRVGATLSCYRRHGANDSGSTVADELARDLARFDRRCEILAEHLRRKGINVDRARWKAAGSPYDWMRHMASLPAELASIIPDGSVLILADEEQLGLRSIGRTTVLPFTERDGCYWGPPESAAHAIAELTRLRRSGASHVAFTSPTFWYLDIYRELEAWLRETCEEVQRSDHLIVYRCLPLRET